MSKTTEQPRPDAAANNDLKIEVSVRPIAPRNNLLGFATVTINDSFVVENFRVCSGEKGLYVNKPITADARNLIVSAIINGYGAAIDKMRETLDASREATEKPSLKGALKDQADKVRKQPVKSAGKSEQSL